jgi:N,N-dimethylformamidase beta subunit-like, C-terminal
LYPGTARRRLEGGNLLGRSRVAAAAVVAALAVVAPAQAGNAVQAENARTGTGAWVAPLAPAHEIEGYTSRVSALPGGTVSLHVSTAPAARYRVVVYRLGWYAGKGARRLACLPSCAGDEQGVARTIPPPDPATGEIRAGWPVTDTFRVGSAWVSGYYLAELVLTSGSDAGKIYRVPFVVRAPPGQPTPILVQAPVDTWQAYNDWGGKSLYHSTSGARLFADRAYKVSFDRPYREPTLQSPLSWEYPLVRFLERNGYDVSYTTDVDTDRDPGEIARHRLVLVDGHSEYWTRTMRTAFEDALATGTNLAFFGADNADWQARYEDGRRTLVVYKDAKADPDPVPAQKTIEFRNLQPPDPECRLVGVQNTWAGTSHDYTVVASSLGDPWFRGTGFTRGATLKGLVGYEWDAAIPGCTAEPLTRFFHYAGPSTVISNADCVRYTAPSGAGVFAAGSLQFSWGLDTFSAPAGSTPDPRLRRFVRNALADLGRETPPLTVAGRALSGGRIKVGASLASTQRVSALLVYRHAGTGSFRPGQPGVVPLGRRPLRAIVDRPPGRGPYRYAVETVDRWGTSPPTLSAPVRAGR